MQTCKKEKAVRASELLSFATNTASPTIGGELGICKEQRDGIASLRASRWLNALTRSNKATSKRRKQKRSTTKVFLFVCKLQ